MNSDAFKAALKLSQPTILEASSETYLEALEKWVLQNEKFIITFLKRHIQEEKDRAQQRFDFAKGL